jgi:hypothetical protein
LQKVTDLVEAICRDHRLVQQVLEITDEVEMEHVSAGDGRVTLGNSDVSGMDESRSSIFSYLNTFSS